MTHKRAQRPANGESSLPDMPWYLPKQPALRKTNQAVVIGAGIAGCTAAVALKQRGFQVQVIDRHATAGMEASGNAQGIVYPKLSARDDFLPRINLAAIDFSSNYYKPFWQQGLGQQCGVLVVPENQKMADDFVLIGERFANRPEMVQVVEQSQLHALSGISLEAKTALHFPNLGWLPPARLCQQLLNDSAIALQQGHVAALRYHSESGNWTLYDENGQALLTSETVVIASAYDCKTLPQTAYLPLRRIRGQITQLPSTPESEKLKLVVCGEGYFTPAERGLHSCGATYNLKHFSTEVRAEDHLANLAQIGETDSGLAAIIGNPELTHLLGRANFRCTTPDYLPIVGAVPNVQAMLDDFAPLRRDAKTILSARGSYLPNLYVNCGMGSRGLSYAPLTAEILAAEIAGEQPSLPRELLNALHPARFIIRDLKRNRI